MMAISAWLRRPVSDSPHARIKARTSGSVRISGGRRRLGFALVAVAVAMLASSRAQGRNHSETALEYLGGGTGCKATPLAQVRNPSVFSVESPRERMKR